jgi:hypothetical protein
MPNATVRANAQATPIDRRIDTPCCDVASPVLNKSSPRADGIDLLRTALRLAEIGEYQWALDLALAARNPLQTAADLTGRL